MISLLGLSAFLSYTVYKIRGSLTMLQAQFHVYDQVPITQVTNQATQAILSFETSTPSSYSFHHDLPADSIRPLGQTLGGPPGTNRRVKCEKADVKLERSVKKEKRERDGSAISTPKWTP